LEVLLFRPFVRSICLVGSLASLAALPMGAQEKSSKETKAASNVPQSAQPPAGMCRIWLENVPASQQPAPTDCASAIKNRPNNARIVFGDLSKEAARPGQKTGTAQTDERTNGWPNKVVDPPRRFDTPNGAPARQVEPRPNGQNAPSGQNDPRRNDASGVRTANSTVPVQRPTTDSGQKRRP
jgi:hypothetical protein